MQHQFLTFFFFYDDVIRSLFKWRVLCIPTTYTQANNCRCVWTSCVPHHALEAVLSYIKVELKRIYPRWVMTRNSGSQYFICIFSQTLNPGRVEWILSGNSFCKITFGKLWCQLQWQVLTKLDSFGVNAAEPATYAQFGLSVCLRKPDCTGRLTSRTAHVWSA